MEGDEVMDVPVVGDGTGSLQLLQTGGLIQGETITLSLEEAAQLIFQQQGLQEDEEGRLQPGTYQIITQPLTSGASNQFSIIHTGNTDAIQGYEFDGQSIYLQQLNEEGIETSPRTIQLTGALDGAGELPDQSQSILAVVKDKGNQFTQQETCQTGHHDMDVQSQSEFDTQSQSEIYTQSQSLQIDLHSNQSEHVFQMINKPVEAQGSHLGQEDSSYYTSSRETVMGESTSGNSTTVNSKENPEIVIEAGSPEGPKQTQTNCDEGNHRESESGDLEEVDNVDLKREKEDVVPVQSAVTSEADDTNATVTKEVHAGKVLNPANKSKAIKKPDLTKPIKVTDHMEVVVGGKKCLLKMDPDTGQLCAYPLISSTASGKRRGRPKKSETENTHKAAPQAADSEQANSAAEGLLELSNTGPDGIRRSSRARKKASSLEDYDMLEVSSDDDAAADNAEDEVLPTGAIRKRRVAFQKDHLNTPPLSLPGVKKGRGRPRRYPRPEDGPTGMQIPAMIIPSGDGQSIMMAPIQGLSNLEAFQEQVRNLQIFQNQKVDGVEDGTQFLNTTATILKPVESTENVVAGLDGTAHSEPLNDAIDNSQHQKPDTNSVATPDFIVTSTGLTPNLITTPGDNAFTVTNAGTEEEKIGDTTQPTIIQIPETLLPMFIQKKDPQKIGLRASNSQLEMFKCKKCEFQGYYEQQYQHHIATHTDDVVKCKCCPFVAFDKEDILVHFKNIHPKCICSVCDHMAEHAYIIKRHMMRHSQIGCKCDICGKVYKDQYVMKMHVKMVHLPAEVLFECTACSKKFTRKAHLKRHLRIHDPEKPFKCPHCPYRGCERSDISKHLLIHEEPKHICEMCNKAFRHVKNKELHMKRHSGQRDYKCGVCDFYGYTFTDIRKHIERKHTDSKAYSCDKCGTAFKSELQLKDHKNQQCDVFMIEQALAIATTDGGTSQATIQIPSHYSLDGHQIQIDGQNMVINDTGQITIENVNLGEDGMTLSSEQFQAVVSQSQMHDGNQPEVQLLPPEMGDDHVVQYAHGHEVVGLEHGTEGVGLAPEDGVMETEIGDDGNEIAEGIEGMDDDMVSDVEDVKPGDSEHMLEMVPDFDR